MRYEWIRNKTGKPYVIISMEYKAEKIIVSYDNNKLKTPEIFDTPVAPGKTLYKN